MRILKQVFWILLLCALTGCSTNGKNTQSTTHKWVEGSDTQKPQHQTTNPSTDPSKDKTQIVQQLSTQNYVKFLPGQLPKTSTTYNMTIRLPKNYQGWNQAALYNQASSSKQPYRIIKGTVQGVERTFRGIPSASQVHMDIFAIGDKFNTNMNAPIELYTNDTLHFNHLVYFVMGHAMVTDHFVEDSNGNKLSMGKENDELSGYWFKLQIGTWYRLMETEPDMKAHLIFEFKLDHSS